MAQKSDNDPPRRCREGGSLRRRTGRIRHWKKGNLLLRESKKNVDRDQEGGKKKGGGVPRREQKGSKRAFCLEHSLERRNVETPKT